MVSDWRNIASGFLHLTDGQFEHAKTAHEYQGKQRPRVSLEIGGDIWFRNGDLLEQVKKNFEVCL
jgi:hypothetical protein